MEQQVGVASNRRAAETS